MTAIHADQVAVDLVFDRTAVTFTSEHVQYPAIALIQNSVRYRKTSILGIERKTRVDHFLSQAKLRRAIPLKAATQYLAIKRDKLLIMGRAQHNMIDQ